jgi:hypothetical protein
MGDACGRMERLLGDFLGTDKARYLTYIGKR